MSVNKQQLLYQSLCDFYEGNLTRTQLEELLYHLKSGGGDSFIGLLSNSILLNELLAKSIGNFFKAKSSPERRRFLLHMVGLRQADAERCDIKLFHPQKKHSQLPKLNGFQNTILAAAYLDAPFSVLMDGGSVPAPAEELPWYHYACLVENTKDTFAPVAFHSDHFQYGRTFLDAEGKNYIGVTALWLKNGFTQITFTVDESTRGVEKWEYQLIKFGAMRHLIGPSIYIASRMVLHSAHHRLYRMIWPSRAKSQNAYRNGLSLIPTVRILLYSRIFTPFATEVSFFKGSPNEQPQTIKYPQARKIEVIHALESIGVLVKRVGEDGLSLPAE